MLKKQSNTLLSKSLNKENLLKTINMEKIDNSIIKSDIDNSNHSIEEFYTKEILDEEENEKNSIEPGMRIRQKKLIKHLANKSDEIRSEILEKVAFKVPKLSYVLKSKIFLIIFYLNLLKK